MKSIINFLAELSQNNNREWFEAHRDRYDDVRRHIDTFAESFIKAMSVYDPSVADLKVKDTTYRIYRDLRFSPDKRPYKTHVGVYLCPHGKKSGYAGYYIHVEPDTDTYMLYSGLYNPSAGTVRSVREEIMTDGEAFDAVVKSCRGFDLDWGSAYKRVPRGWSAEDEYSDYYRLRSYDVSRKITSDDVVADDFVQHAAEELSVTCGYNSVLNRCVDYAREMGWQ